MLRCLCRAGVYYKIFEMSFVNCVRLRHCDIDCPVKYFYALYKEAITGILKNN
jgi:hypothetical protein